jgi:hypothetical protein
VLYPVTPERVAMVPLSPLCEVLSPPMVVLRPMSKVSLDVALAHV